MKYGLRSQFVENNPYHPPTIPSDDKVTSARWRRHKWPRIVTALVGGSIVWLLMPIAQDYPELTTKLAVVGFAGGAAVGYAACLVIQVLSDNSLR